jgi:hypothetical protein
MPLTLAEWDAWIKPHLQNIEAGAELCAKHVRKLAFQPEFTTLASEAMDEAEMVLVQALKKLRAAQRAYRELPPGD